MPPPNQPNVVFQRLWNLNVAAILCLITLAWPALWLLWMKPAVRAPQPPPVAAPVIRHFLAGGGDDSGLWSTLLFSLPAPYGFSRTVRMEWLENRGIPVVPPSSPPLRHFDPRPHPLPAAARADSVTARLANEFSVYRPAPPDRQASTYPPDNTPYWHAAPELQARGFALPEAWREQLPESTEPGSATIAVELGENGHVLHAFLTAPHAHSNANRSILAIIRQGRADASENPASGVVTVVLP